MSQLFSGKDTLLFVAKHAKGMSLRYGVVLIIPIYIKNRLALFWGSSRLDGYLM